MKRRRRKRRKRKRRKKTEPPRDFLSARRAVSQAAEPVEDFLVAANHPVLLACDALLSCWISQHSFRFTSQRIHFSCERICLRRERLLEFSLAPQIPRRVFSALKCENYRAYCSQPEDNARHRFRSDSVNSSAGILCRIAKLLFDSQELIVFCDAIGAAGGSGFDLTCSGSHSKVSDERVFGLA